MPFLDSVTVLNVDDTEATRYARRRALEAAGFSVTEAANGHDALAIARESQPTVIVLDVHLPDMNGFEVCRRLKASPETAGIAVLQISAMYASDEARVTALEGGADAYLSEPVDPRVLQATVNALARMRKAEREQRHANRRLALLSDTAYRLLTSPNPQEFMRELFPKLSQELGLEIYFNMLLTAENPQRLKLHSYGGVTPEDARKVEYIALGEAVCGRVAQSGERILVDDVLQRSDEMTDAIRNLGVSSYCCYPLIANGKMLGTLSFGSRARARFDASEVELMQAIANQFAVALERARLNEELQTQASRLKAVLDNTVAVIYVVDEDGRLQLANKQFLMLFGDPPPRTPLRELFPAEAAEQFLVNNRQVLESREACEFEETVMQADGLHTYLSIKVPLFDAEGRATAICGISSDITKREQALEELRQRERRIRRLIDSNIVGVMLADTELIRDANDIFLNTVGYTREDLAAGKLAWRAMTPPEHMPATDRAFRELMARGAFAPYEKEYYRKDGSRVPVLIGGAALNDTGERLCFVLDLSERKKTEARLVEAQKLESIGFLAGGVAHNLNNLLVGIMGNVSLVQSDIPERPAEQERLESALEACERAAHLASELLAYAGKGRYFPSPTNLSTLIERDLKPVLRGSIPVRVDLQFELAPDLPELKLDSNQIRQIVTNLVQNAAEAIGENAGRITIRTARRDGHVVLSVSDTGSGMDEATRARIFDPFFTTKFTGRGLGLAAVAGIVRAYDGSIRVTSAPGQGSVFEILLPTPDVAPPAPPEGFAPAARQRVVLVVDDEPVVQQTVRATLERGGFSVLIAGSGVRAVELMEERGGDIDLVLLDLAMPGMGGEEVLEKIRAIRPQVAVAICSGFAEAQVAPRFADKNVQGFVKKPFTAQRLLSAANALAPA